MTDLLKHDFTFTQSNLQTFAFCRHRFYLRYVKKLIWPAALLSGSNYLLDRDAGVRFHQLLHQYFLGLDLDHLQTIAAADSDQRMEVWFDNFLYSPVSRLEGRLQSEASFTTTIKGHNLGAKVDLLQIDQDFVKIFDWKTSRKLPGVTQLKSQAQSMVYPLVISKAFPFDNIIMVYWEANFPDQPIEITSKAQDLQQYEQKITELIDTITNLPAEGFVRVSEISRCSWCEYATYCGRADKNAEAKLTLEPDDYGELKIVPEEWLDSSGLV